MFLSESRGVFQKTSASALFPCTPNREKKKRKIVVLTFRRQNLERIKGVVLDGGCDGDKGVNFGLERWFRTPSYIGRS